KASNEKDKQLASLILQQGESNKEVLNLAKEVARLKAELDNQINKAEAALRGQTPTADQAQRITRAKEESEKLEDFRGRSRAAAKTSLSESRVEEFSSLRELVTTNLPTDAKMRQAQITK